MRIALSFTALNEIRYRLDNMEECADQPEGLAASYGLTIESFEAMQDKVDIALKPMNKTKARFAFLDLTLVEMRAAFGELENARSIALDNVDDGSDEYSVAARRFKIAMDRLEECIKSIEKFG